VLVGACLAGCRQEMAEQPSFKPLQANSFFDDGRASRPLEPGVIPREQFQADLQLSSGARPQTNQAVEAAREVAQGAMAPAARLGAVASRTPGELYFDSFPIEMTREVLERGRQRFNIYCSVCHDRLGTGNGIVVQRGFTKPPDLITDASRGLAYQGMNVSLREVPVGYLFEVITRGFGAMPDYAQQISLRDRWAIVGYLRALQLSRHAPIERLSPEDKAALDTLREGKP
jgi:mono/diheme cytochrome c family protein